MLLAQMVNTVTAINMVPIMQQVEKEHLKWKKEIKILHDYNKKKNNSLSPLNFTIIMINCFHLIHPLALIFILF